MVTIMSVFTVQLDTESALKNRNSQETESWNGPTCKSFAMLAKRVDGFRLDAFRLQRFRAYNVELKVSSFYLTEILGMWRQEKWYPFWLGDAKMKMCPESLTL
jgi:hypothetical protein